MKVELDTISFSAAVKLLLPCVNVRHLCALQTLNFGPVIIWFVNIKRLESRWSN